MWSPAALTAEATTSFTTATTLMIVLGASSTAGKVRDWVELSARGPVRVAAKETAREPDLIDEKQAKPQADQARRDAKSPTYARGNFTSKHNGQADGRRNENHARDGSDAKDEEVDHRPKGVANRC